MDEIIKLDTKGILPAIPVENYRRVLDYLVGDIKRNFRLSRKLKDEFTKIFGKHNTIYRGEFLNYVWIIQFQGEIFEIFTSNRGTTFEIVDNYSDGKIDLCIDFLKKIDDLIIKLEKE